MVLSFNECFTKFFVIRTKSNLRPDINYQIYVDIIAFNKSVGNIDEFAYGNFKWIMTVEEIDEAVKVVTVFFSSASSGITVLFTMSPW